MQAFRYERASDPVSAARSFGPSAQFLGGGTTLLDLMKTGAMQADQVIDINDLDKQYGAIAQDNGVLRIGAFVRMAEAAAHPLINSDYPVIAQSLQLAASAQIRNMARLGGNVLQRTRCNYFRDVSYTQCNKRNPGSGCAAMDGVNRKHAVLGTSKSCIATYPGDFAQSMIALDAEVEIAGDKGVRKIRFEDLHRLPGDKPQLETNLWPGEIILGFNIPSGAHTKRSLYLKIRDRQSYEFALASAAVALDMDGATVKSARIALGGVATKPWRAREAESLLTGKTLDMESAGAAAKAAFASAIAQTQNGYKPELGRRTLRRALLQAAGMKV